MALDWMEGDEEGIPPDADVTTDEFCDGEYKDKQKVWKLRAALGCSRSSYQF